MMTGWSIITLELSNEDLTLFQLPYGTMRQIIPALLGLAPVALASQTVFSVHDDLLAFPQVSLSNPPFAPKLTSPSIK